MVATQGTPKVTALMLGLFIAAYIFIGPYSASADYAPQEIAAQSALMAAVGDPQYLVSQSSNQTTSDDMSNSLNVFQTVQTSQNLTLANDFDHFSHQVASNSSAPDSVNQYYYGTVSQTINYSAGVSPPPDSSKSYSDWQKAGYYNTFTPAQQTALQALQPILAANDDTAYYRYDPTTGSIQIQASGLIGQLRLLTALASLGIANQTYGHYFEDPNDYFGPGGDTAPGPGGIFGTIFGVYIQVPPSPPQQNEDGNNAPQGSGGPPTRSPAVGLNG